SYSAPMRFGSGLALCGTVKAGVLSGYKAGPCFAVSFRTERLTFEMETQLLIGGTRHSIDWVFPMSFVIPLTSQRSLYEGLQLRVGGSPIGVTFAKDQDGGNYIRFGLHAGTSYELDMTAALTWKVFDARDSATGRVQRTETILSERHPLPSRLQIEARRFGRILGNASSLVVNPSEHRRGRRVPLVRGGLEPTHRLRAVRGGPASLFVHVT